MQFWEWAANPRGSIFTLLLRKSSEGGGGEFFGYSKGYAERSAVPDDVIAGRWAGDRIWLAGDLRSSRIWGDLTSYRNMSEQVAATWNSLIEIADMRLEFRS